MAGSARIEIFRQANKNNGYPGTKEAAPLQVLTQATSEAAATTAGSRMVVTATGNGGSRLFARIANTEACYVAIGADPTASPTALGYLLQPNIPLEVEVTVGQKLSFIDVA